jgi:hypothetical protein
MDDENNDLQTIITQTLENAGDFKMMLDPGIKQDLKI